MKYLEGAPSTWSGGSDPSSAWSGNTSANVSTATGIGTGAKNSQEMLNTDPPTGAAKLATDYRGNGLSDWYLPSKDELLQLSKRRGKFPAGSFTAGGYWTSSQDSASRAWITTINTQAQITRPKGNSQFVRPIRAFAPVG